MNISPRMQGVGCLNSLVYLGSLVGGIYRGVNEANGNPVDPSTITKIIWGPAALNGLIGIGASRVAKNDGTLDALVDRAPSNMDYEQAEGCANGCVTVTYPAMAVGVSVGLHFLGYAIGQAIGRS